MLDVLNPYNGQLIKQVPLNSGADVEKALAIAYATFNVREQGKIEETKQPGWRLIPTH